MINLDELPMRDGLGQFRELSDERLQFIKQFGCDDFQMNTPALPGADRWEYEDISQLVQRATDAGLRLMSIENVPKTFVDKIMLGLPGRKQQLDNMAYTIRNLGRSGAPILGDGNCSPVETIRVLKEIGFNGFLIPDHVPRMVDDTDWCHRGRAWTVGYIKALIAAVEA
ncbi:MAG: mannonate dehydratase [Pirellulaceae bacterium]|jgi:D-mannonate dehydratase|nr:mannonate dehydratase [Pirellulaceae bacterium]HJN11637.1 mannonate dehydratase [Pirellulaceae bacterium]